MRKKAEDEHSGYTLRLEQWSKIAGQNRSEGKASRRWIYMRLGILSAIIPLVRIKMIFTKWYSE